MFIHEVLKRETGQICKILYINCMPDKCKRAKYRTQCNFFQASVNDVVLVTLMLTLNKFNTVDSVYIVDFELENVSWEINKSVNKD